MVRIEAIEKLTAQADVLREMGVTSLHVFGSTIDGRSTAMSDLDIFVDHDPERKFSLFDLVGVKLLIERQLGIEADVTTRSGLHPMLRLEIERDAVRVF